MKKKQALLIPTLLSILTSLSISTSFAQTPAQEVKNQPAVTKATEVGEGSEWIEINNEDGIKVSSKKIPGSKIVAFRGETTIATPIEKLFWVLVDNKHRTDWVDRLKTSEIVESINPFHYVLYQEFKLPFPLQNRDFVYKGEAKRDSATGVVTLDLMSVEHPKVPHNKGVVRAELYHSAYVLTPINPNSTKIMVEIYSDPKGLLPSWLVNVIQKKWPIKTLNGIKKQVAKDFVETAKLP